MVDKNKAAYPTIFNEFCDRLLECEKRLAWGSFVQGKVVDIDENASRQTPDPDHPANGRPMVRVAYQFTPDDYPVLSTWIPWQDSGGNNGTWTPPTVGMSVLVHSPASMQPGGVHSGIMPFWFTDKDGEKINSKAFKVPHDRRDQTRRYVEVKEPENTLGAETDPDANAEANSSSGQPGPLDGSQSEIMSGEGLEWNSVKKTADNEQSWHRPGWDKRLAGFQTQMNNRPQLIHTADKDGQSATIVHQDADRINRLAQTGTGTDSAQKEQNATLHQVLVKDGGGEILKPLIDDYVGGGTNIQPGGAATVSTIKKQLKNLHQIISQDGDIASGSGGGGAGAAAGGAAAGGGAAGGGAAQQQQQAPPVFSPLGTQVPNQGMVTSPNTELWDRTPIELLSGEEPPSGDVDLTTAPVPITNPDGTVTLVPTIQNGQQLTPTQATATGQSLGTFAATPAAPATQSQPAQSAASSSQNASSFTQALQQAQQALQQVTGQAGGGQSGQGRKTTRSINPALHWIESLMGNGDITQRNIIPGTHNTKTTKVSGGSGTTIVDQTGEKKTETQTGTQPTHSITQSGGQASISRMTPGNYSNNALQTLMEHAGQTLNLSGGGTSGLSAGGMNSVAAGGVLHLAGHLVKIGGPVKIFKKFIGWGTSQPGGGGSGAVGSSSGGVTTPPPPPTEQPTTEQPVVNVAPKGYEYFRFVPTKLRSPTAAGVLLAELIIALNDERVDYTDAEATNPGGNNPNGHGPAEGIDDDVETYWMDWNKDNLVIHFAEKTEADSFTFTTASDSPDCDPIQWRLEASNDGTTWEVLHEQDTDYDTTEERETQQEWFTLEVETHVGLNAARINVEGGAQGSGGGGSSLTARLQAVDNMVQALSGVSGSIESLMEDPVALEETVLGGVANLTTSSASLNDRMNAIEVALGEGGSWTPVLAFGGSSSGVVYSTQIGWYTRIGQTVFAWAQIVLTSNGSGSGAATISGLPFATPGGRPAAVGIFVPTVALSNVSGNVLACRLNSGTQVLGLYVDNSALTDSNITNTGAFAVQITYSM